MISEQEKVNLHDYLALWYRGQWTQAHTEALCAEFDYLGSGPLTEACRRHIHDQQAGAWAPKVADIEAQLTALHSERSRAAQEARLKELKQESDQTYLQAVLGQGESWDERVQAWGRRIQGNIRKAAAVRSRLQANSNLDYRQQRHMKLLMDTLGEIDLESQTLEEIEEVAREVAGQLGVDLEGMGAAPDHANAGTVSRG